MLIALATSGHVHHRPALDWFRHASHSFATCPITQGSLIRAVLGDGQGVEAAVGLLDRIVSLPGHAFWSDDLSYLEVSLEGVVGRRQVTDAYLAQLARGRGGRLATFDRGLAALHPDVADLVVTGQP